MSDLSEFTRSGKLVEKSKALLAEWNFPPATLAQIMRLTEKSADEVVAVIEGECIRYHDQKLKESSSGWVDKSWIGALVDNLIRFQCFNEQLKPIEEVKGVVLTPGEIDTWITTTLKPMLGQQFGDFRHHEFK